MSLDENINKWLNEYYAKRKENELNESLRTFRRIHADKRIEKYTNELNDIYKSADATIKGKDGTTWYLLNNKDDKRATKLENKRQSELPFSTFVKPYENCKVGEMFFGSFSIFIKEYNGNIICNALFEKINGDKNTKIIRLTASALSGNSKFDDYNVVGESYIKLPGAITRILALKSKDKNRPTMAIVACKNPYFIRLFTSKPYSERELAKLSKNKYNSWQINLGKDKK